MRTVCECVVEHRSNNSDNTEGKETWIRIASEHRLSVWSVQNLKKFDVTECLLHANQECILKRAHELKSFRKLFSMKLKQLMGCLVVRISFYERPTETELAANKPALPEIEHLKGKISDKELDSLRAVLSRNADVFSKHKSDKGCCNFVEHEIEIEEDSVRGE